MAIFFIKDKRLNIGCDKLKRLIKQSIMNIEMFKGSLNQLSDEGRNILKLIEDYKFKLDQTCRLTANDQQLTQKLQQKRKQLDVASGQIYSIVFDIDNIDITKAYEQQQINTNPNMPSNPTNSPKPNMPTNIPQQQNNQPQQNQENSDATSDSGPVGGGPIPSSAPASNDTDKEPEENTENENTDSESESNENDNEGNEE